jgi:radical SAM superfamily enzyme YgiQ (UPF0313 family)
MVPPILEYLGALTVQARPDVELSLIDADQAPFDPDAIEADVVGISTMTATCTWAYQAADALRARGIPVVLGGIHASAMPDEAAEHADAVVVGEAESVWARVLDDVEAGTLQPRYVGERCTLEGLPQPLAGAVKGDYRFRAIFTMRGCPYRCSFCSVRRFFGDSIRYRPIDEVVDEVERCAGSVWFNGDDNIWGGDLRRSTELFRRLASETRRRSWYGFGDLRSVQIEGGEEMLAAARDSGLFSVWAGWESVSPESLAAFKARGKLGRDREEAVRRIKSHGIDVVLFMVLGSREDSEADFAAAIETADRLGVSVHPVLLTPLPGTELYEEYRPYLYDELGWDAYTGTRALFEHPTLSPARREELYYETSLELLSLPRVVKHLGEIGPAGFPRTHLLSTMKSLPMRRAMKRAYAEWRSTPSG